MQHLAKLALILSLFTLTSPSALAASPDDEASYRAQRILAQIRAVFFDPSGLVLEDLGRARMGEGTTPRRPDMCIGVDPAAQPSVLGEPFPLDQTGRKITGKSHPK